MRFDSVDWKLAHDLYYDEKLVESYEQAIDTGMGQAGQYLDFFRMIEAEYLTMLRSTVAILQEQLELEYIPDEVGPNLPTIETATLEAVQLIGGKLSYVHSSNTRITVLAEETDAPWLHGRWGYCIQKNPYFKICIPLAVVSLPDRLRETLIHEYAHVAVGTIAGRRAPRWLNEAVAQNVSGEALLIDPATFGRGKAPWLSSHDLEIAFGAPQSSAQRRKAYEQSALIGLYLAERFGGPKLGDLLKGFSNSTLLHELWLRLRSIGPEEHALMQTYQVRVDELFEEAKLWALERGG